MDRVEEIESTTERLPPEEFARIARWFRERDHALWDRELDADSESGKLDFLFGEAEHESKHSLLREWPAPK
jgi:hypothetical protein